MPANSSHFKAPTLIRRSSEMLQGILRAQASRPAELLVCMPTMTFSSTVIPPNSSIFWNVRTMASRASFSGGKPVTSFPSSSTVPALCRYIPVIMLKSVVLPAPFGPMTPVMSPFDMEKETESSAVTPPKIWVMPDTSSMVGHTFLPYDLPVQGGDTAHESSGHVHHHDHQQTAVDDDVVLVGAAQKFRQQGQQRRSQE